MDESEIRAKLLSNEVAVLKQSLSFVNDKLTLERSRAAKAETRATAVFAVTGILAGFVVHFAKLLNTAITNKWLVISFYVGSIYFLHKAALFALRSLWVRQACELSPELAFEVQAMTENDAIREETIWKIWEYYELLPLTNWRLFYTNRAHRNLFAAMISFALLSLAWFLGQLNVQVPKCVTVLAVLLLTLIAIFLDKIFERFGSLWKLD